MDKEFEDLKIYMHYYIKMIALNYQLDTRHVCLHNIYTFDEFRTERVSNAYSYSELKIDEYKRQWIRLKEF